MPTNRSFFSQFIGSLIGFRPRSPSSGSPIKTSVFSTSSARRRSTSSLNSSGSGGASAKADRDAGLAGEKWWIGGRRADGSERYYPIAPLRYFISLLWLMKDGIDRRIGFHYKSYERTKERNWSWSTNVCIVHFFFAAYWDT